MCEHHSVSVCACALEHFCTDHCIKHVLFCQPCTDQKFGVCTFGTVTFTFVLKTLITIKGGFGEVRDFSKGITLDKDSALCLFHPTKNRLKSFIQFRWGHPKGLGVVIDDEASKKFSIPQRHRLFRVTHVELYACWHESHEVYESQDTQTDGEIVLADSYFHRNYSFLLSVKWVARE